MTKEQKQLHKDMDHFHKHYAEQLATYPGKLDRALKQIQFMRDHKSEMMECGWNVDNQIENLNAWVKHYEDGISRARRWLEKIIPDTKEVISDGRI